MKRTLARRRAVSVLVGCMAIYMQHQVLAQTTAQGSLPEVRVDANAEAETATTPVIGYRAKNAVTATKTDTPLSETPQSVTVVTRDQIVDQGATNLQDALNYAAGVRSDAYGLDSRTDSVRVRGAYPDVYLDGLRQAYGYYTSTTRTEPYTLERLEVLRGPSGMLFGAGTAAGVVNMVSKRPLQEAQREVGVQFGSFGRKQIQADLTGPLNADGSLSYRLIAVQRKSDTQVDYVPDDRSLIAPSLTWRPNAATSLTLQGLWQKDKSGSSSQFLPWEGTLLPNPNGRLPASRFIGEPGDFYNSERKTFGWLFEHKFNDNWTVRQNFRYAQNENANQYHYGAAFSGFDSWSSDPVSKRVLGRYFDNQLTLNRTQTLDNHVEGHFQTGALKHTLLIGADFARQRENVWSGTTVDIIDVYAPVYGHRDVPEAVALPRTRQRQTGLYLQDQIKLDNWIFVAGLRHDKAVSSAAGSDEQKSSATTKRFGLMYASPSGWSPYVSYSESFTPQSPRQGRIFTPLRGEQWEVGVKYEPKDRAVAFSAAVYDLREKNQIVEEQPNVFSQRGLTRTKGLELEAKGSIGRDLDLIAHYNYIDADAQIEGLPKHQASVWAKYRFSIGGASGFSAGAGVRAMSSFRDVQFGTGPRIPGVVLADLVFAYDTASWRYALNINNVTDKKYFSTCLSRGDCWYGSRRNIVASATYRF
ncbi:iron complex outermembrane receptor protein [Variovorax boronicumulans]|uniref:TonB-dependent siderophore receptor n=1 Tax=Variovorax boronicumulans TaxID=436515 RepID=UPI00247659E5|nr:TonB-dependent siderophore receptor [Variovorax boronicumulans]MDH6168608.1 iron complex outermembrane receptor protein [Variovorax boronicumulans]